MFVHAKFLQNVLIAIYFIAKDLSTYLIIRYNRKQQINSYVDRSNCQLTTIGTWKTQRCKNTRKELKKRLSSKRWEV